jgi:hypothetical protein
MTCKAVSVMSCHRLLVTTEDRCSIPGLDIVVFGGKIEYGTAVSESTSIFYRYTTPLWIPLTLGSKTQVCSRLNAGIALSNPAEGMSFRLFCWLCVVWVAASGHSLRGLLLCVRVCVRARYLETSTMRRSRLKLGCSPPKLETVFNNNSYNHLFI